MKIENAIKKILNNNIKIYYILIIMNCSVCNNPFMLSRNQEDYIKKKAKMDEQHCKYIDENIEKDEQLCWIKVMNEEALLLKPNENPNYCPAEVCGAIICRYCYGNNKKYYEKRKICKLCNNPYKNSCK
jgi:hypothetical protein